MREKDLLYEIKRIKNQYVKSDKDLLKLEYLRGEMD